MIQFFLIALLVMAVIAALAILIAVLQGKRARKAEKENATLHDAFSQVQQRAERLQEALGKTEKIGEDADAERRELDQTSDSALVNRANGLFGVQNNKKHPGGAGSENAGGNKASGT